MTQLPPPDRQREHQANERTFLAWLRTAIALIGFGLALSRFALFLRELQSAVTREDSATHPLINYQIIGLGMIIIGILIIALSAWHYNQVFTQIEQGNYRPNQLMVWIVTAVTICFGIATIPFVLWRQPPSNKKISLWHKSRGFESNLSNFSSLRSSFKSLKGMKRF